MRIETGNNRRPGIARQETRRGLCSLLRCVVSQPCDSYHGTQQVDENNVAS